MFTPEKINIIGDISIPLRFGGPQPNAYGVNSAVSEPMLAGKLVGDVRRGGSVNFERYVLIPHCNGTHTECIGHLTQERIPITECLQDILFSALLVSIEAVPASATGETLPLNHSRYDSIITRDALAKAFNQLDGEMKGLIIRTLPNNENKLSCQYDSENIPAYFSREAMELIVTSGIQHLLTDLPSIDRLYDDGHLENHRLFWGMKPGQNRIDSASRRFATVTEMIYVPNEIPDSVYLVNLQIPPFVADAAPSRPVLCTIDN